MKLPVLAATLGHANLRSVMKYVHITAEHIDDEMLRIEQIQLERALAKMPSSVDTFLPLPIAETGED